MKEKTIGQCYISVLGLSREHPDALKLLKYKNPKFAGMESGDFCNCLEAVMISRNKKRSTTTIAEVNKLLNDIVKADNRSQRIALIRRIMNTYSALEQKWLCRIMLKDLKIGFRQESMLREFHKEATDTLHKTSSLEKVCEMAMDPDWVAGSATVGLFHLVSPMLAQRRKHNDIIEVMNGRKFGIEIKFDGERVQLHYKRGDKFKLISRRGTDLQTKYGYAESFQKTINSAMTCNSCILDGEMMAWNSQKKQYVAFGGNREAAASGISGLGDTHLVYIVFDCLMIDGKVVMNQNLLMRRKYAKECFKELKLHMEMSQIWTNCTTMEDIVGKLELVFKQRHEGVMVKRLDAPYMPGKRDPTAWIKLKPDYVDDMSFHFDLLILGGYYGEGSRRAGGLSHFLLGLAEPPIPGHRPRYFFTFCKVGTGYNLEELKKLQKALEPHVQDYDPRNPPFFLKSWHPEPDDVPDKYIPPEKSVIMEMKGGEITATRDFKFLAGKTIRFPRCVRIRYDKPWHQCDTMKDLMAKESQFKNQVGKKRDRKRDRERAAQLLAVEEAPRKKRKMTRRKLDGVILNRRPTDVREAKQKTDIFKDYNFCMLNVEYGMKAEIEFQIKEHGGVFSQNMVPETTHYVADIDDLRVKAHREFAGNVIKTLWIRECAIEEKLIPYAPRHLLHAEEDVLERFRTDYDKYGDPYCDELSLHQISNILDLMEDPPLEEQDALLDTLSYEEQNAMVQADRLFERVVAYVDRWLESGEVDLMSKMGLLEAQMLIHGATITSKIDDNVTHVVVEKNGEYRPRLKSIEDRIFKVARERDMVQIYLVTEKWVQDCIEEETLLEESNFKVDPVDIDDIEISLD